MKIVRVFGTVALLTGGTAASVTAQSAIPTPESVLGSRVGADFFLATYEESMAYFQQLAAASDRIQLVEVGRTSEGRPWSIALISAAENLANVDRYRDIALQLARPDELTDELLDRLRELTARCGRLAT